MPFVSLWGVGVSDIPFGVVAGAINVVLMYDLLRLTGVSLPARRWLAALFAAGTAHWYIAAIGSYWFNAHVVAVLFVTLYARETLGRAGDEWQGRLALAGLARPTVLFAAPFSLRGVDAEARCKCVTTGAGVLGLPGARRWGAPGL
jgi:hypothetical protein